MASVFFHDRLVKNAPRNAVQSPAGSVRAYQPFADLRPMALCEGVSPSNSPSDIAIAASWALDEQPILARICSMWVDTVRGDTNSCWAICGFNAPPATSAAPGLHAVTDHGAKAPIPR